MDSGTVGKPGVRNRGGCVHPPVHAAYDLLDHLLQLLLRLEAPVPGDHPAPPLQEDAFVAVHHDLPHLRIVNELLQEPKPPEGIEKSSAKPQPVGEGEEPAARFPADLLIDELPELPVIHGPCQGPVPGDPLRKGLLQGLEPFRAPVCALSVAHRESPLT